MLCEYLSQRVWVTVGGLNGEYAALRFFPKVDYLFKAFEVNCYWVGDPDTITFQLCALAPDGVTVLEYFDNPLVTKVISTDLLPTDEAKRYLFEFDEAIQLKAGIGYAFTVGIASGGVLGELYFASGVGTEFPEPNEPCFVLSFDAITWLPCSLIKIYFIAWGEPQQDQPTAGLYMGENWELNDTETGELCRTDQFCQTITCAVSHKSEMVRFLCLILGDAGDLYIQVKAVDEDDESETYGQPIGDPIAEVIYRKDDMPTDNPAWVSFCFVPPYIDLAMGTKYAVVLSSPDSADPSNCWAFRVSGGGVPPSPYEAGEIWLSGDSGETWEKADGYSFCFSEWGELPISPTNTKYLDLIPNGDGYYKELGCGIPNRLPGEIDNWECVAQVPELSSPLTSAVFMTFQHDFFRSGYLSGTIRIQSGYAGIQFYKSNFDPQDIDTDMLNELFENYLIRDEMGHHIYKVKSVQNDHETTLYKAPYGDKPSSCPNRNDNAYWTPSTGGWGTPPAFKLTGKVTFTHDSDQVTGVRTKFLSEIWGGASAGGGDHIRSAKYPGYWLPVLSVESDKSLTLYPMFKYGGPTHTEGEGETFAFGSYHVCVKDEFEYCKPMKRDSYRLKQTKNPNNILAFYVAARVGAYSFYGGNTSPEADGYLMGTVTWYKWIREPGSAPWEYNFVRVIEGVGTAFSTELERGKYIWRPGYPGACCRVKKVYSDTLASFDLATPNNPPMGSDAEGTTPYCGYNVGKLTPQTCHATIFIRLKEKEIYGERHAIVPMQTLDKTIPEYESVIYVEPFNRPGGGVWTWDDLNNVEVGLAFEIPDECGLERDSAVYYPTTWCSGIVGRVLLEPASGVPLGVTQGISEIGLIVDDSMDEWGQQVDGELTTLSHLCFLDPAEQVISGQGRGRSRKGGSRGRARGLIIDGKVAKGPSLGHEH